MGKRRRRTKSAVVAAATVAAIKARKRAFLREVSSLLSDALGFPVRVSMVRPEADLSPEQRRAQRRSAKDNRALIRASAEALMVPLASHGISHPPEPFDAEPASYDDEPL